MWRFFLISNLVDYLNTNLFIAHFYIFNISRSLSSHGVFGRFLKNFDNNIFQYHKIASTLGKGIIDTSFTDLDSTLIAMNNPTKQSEILFI